MCDLCDNGVLQMPSTCPWCSSQVTVQGYSLYMQLVNYTAHFKDNASCVGMYTSVVDKYGVVQEQAVPIVKGLLSDADLRRAVEYHSDYVTIYISVNGHRQWPSMGQPLINFIATLIGNARVAFIQEMIALRKKQAHARENNLDIPKKEWKAPVKWYKGTGHPRAGPPKERLESLLSTTPIHLSLDFRRSWSRNLHSSRLVCSRAFHGSRSRTFWFRWWGSSSLRRWSCLQRWNPLLPQRLRNSRISRSSDRRRLTCCATRGSRS